MSQHTRLTERTFAVVCLVLFWAAPAFADHTAFPSSVTAAGSFQSELGCPGDWMPDCAISSLTLDAGDQVWQGSFIIPGGAYEYKVALNGSWAENYGAGAAEGGANIILNLAGSRSVKFYYSHETHWITDNVNSIIASVPGNYQSELGCPGDWQPDCLRSWLQDPDGDGIYTFLANLPVGTYEAKAAIDESWTENYGEGGVPDGANIGFLVGAASTGVLFSYDSEGHILTIEDQLPAEIPEPSTAALAVAGLGFLLSLRKLR